jgi:hypothetical protein
MNSVHDIDWKGEWRNEYDSRLTITDDSGYALHGTFETALGLLRDGKLHAAWQVVSDQAVKDQAVKVVVRAYSHQ